MPVAWYRFAATFGRKRSAYLTLVLLIGLLGGVAMGSVAAAWERGPWFRPRSCRPRCNRRSGTRTPR
jgi:hypothetical protein